MTDNEEEGNILTDFLDFLFAPFRLLFGDDNEEEETPEVEPDLTEPLVGLMIEVIPDRAKSHSQRPGEYWVNVPRFRRLYFVNNTANTQYVSDLKAHYIHETGRKVHITPFETKGLSIEPNAQLTYPNDVKTKNSRTFVTTNSLEYAIDSNREHAIARSTEYNMALSIIVEYNLTAAGLTEKIPITMNIGRSNLFFSAPAGELTYTDEDGTERIVHYDAM